MKYFDINCPMRSKTNHTDLIYSILTGIGILAFAYLYLIAF